MFLILFLIAPTIIMFIVACTGICTAIYRDYQVEASIAGGILLTIISFIPFVNWLILVAFIVFMYKNNNNTKGKNLDDNK